MESSQNGSNFIGMINQICQTAVEYQSLNFPEFRTSEARLRTAKATEKAQRMPRCYHFGPKKIRKVIFDSYTELFI